MSSLGNGAPSATTAEQARDTTLALGITVDTTAGTKVAIGDHVIAYDSGWRDISHLLQSGWTAEWVRIKRTLHDLYIKFKKLDGTAATGNYFIVLPPGFRPGANVVMVATILNGPNIYGESTRVTSEGSSGEYLRSLTGANGTTNGNGEIIWSTAQPPPQSLPGTPA